ncbi:MAG: trimethylamine methyltransferase family protein, partial [Planctomycetota bacterium]
MKRLRFALRGGLERADLEEIHRQVLKVLEEIGIEVAHEKARLTAARHPGVREDGSRLYFAPGLVDEFVERAREEHEAEPVAEEITLAGPWNCFNIEDLDTGRVRPSTLEDVREMFKLLRRSDAGPISPVYPTDVEPRLQVLALEKAGLELTESNGSMLEFSDHEMLEFAIRMHAAAGRKYHISVQFPISPLRVNPSALETIWRYKDRDDVELTAASSPIPQAGA